MDAMEYMRITNNVIEAKRELANATYYTCGEVDIDGIRDALRKANDLLNNALGWTEEVYTGK